MDQYALAAAKHLKDATALLIAARFDGAAYLAGYVVECTLKAMLQTVGESSSAHSLRDLKDELSRLAACKRGVKALTPTHERILQNNGLYKWRPSMRYQAEGCITADNAKSMVQGASSFYHGVKP